MIALMHKASLAETTAFVTVVELKSFTKAAKQLALSPPRSTGMCILAFCRKLVSIVMDRRYRPELHYMRGPGPKWIERHGR